MANQLKPTAALVTKLSRKPAPKPVVNATATNSTNGTTATDGANSTNSTTIPDAEAGDSADEEPKQDAGSDEL